MDRPLAAKTTRESKLDATSRSPLAERALRIVQRELEDSLQAKQLAALGRVLPLELQEEALRTAQEFSNPGYYLESLFGLAPRLTSRLLEEVFEDALNTAQPYLKRLKLSFLVPYLLPESRAFAIEAALSARTKDAQEPDDLVTLTDALPERLKWAALPAQIASQQGTFSISDAFDRTKGLRQVVTLLRPDSGPHLFRFVHELFAILARRSRSEFLSDVRALAPLLSDVGGAEALRRSVTAIEDVSAWWP